MKKHILTLMLSLALMFGCFAGLGITASAAETDGHDPEATQVEVRTAAELYYYAEQDARNEIKLMTDIKTNRMITVKGQITINLNGFKIDRGLTEATDDGSVFKVDVAELNIYDGSEDQTGMITGGYSDAEGGALDIEGGIAGSRNSIARLYSGKLCGNKAENAGGAVHVGFTEAAAFVMYGGEICDNEVTDGDGGALYLNYGDIRIYGGTIKNNKASGSAGAIYCDNSFQYSTALLIEGEEDSPVVFENNDAGQFGGAIFINDGIVEINNAVFKGNRSSYDGGAVYCDDDDGTIIENATFTENKSGGYGSAIYIDTDDVLLRDITVTNNNSDKSGAVVSWGNSFSIEGKMVIKDNTMHGKVQSGANMYLVNESGFSSHVFLYNNLDAGSDIRVYNADERLSGFNISCQKNDVKAENNLAYFTYDDPAYECYAIKGMWYTNPDGTRVFLDMGWNEIGFQEKKSPTAEYTVVTKTGHRYFDDTTYNCVEIDIYGVDGTHTGFIKLDGVYERNDEDKNVFTATNVGDIAKFRLKHTAVNDWGCAWVEINNVRYTINKEFRKTDSTIEVDVNTGAITMIGDSEIASFGSVFGEGSVWAIVAIVEALVLAGVVTYMIVDKKKRKPVVADGAEENSEE